MSDADLAYRSGTPLGSTLADPPTSGVWAEEDVLTGNATLNPLFYNFNSIYMRYCCGSSRTSHRDGQYAANTTLVYMRGADILRSTLDVLLGATPAPGLPSLASATEVVVGGGSAGALSVILHADYIASRVAAVAPSARVVAVANDGFFIDGVSIWGSRLLTGVFFTVTQWANSTGGAPEQGSGACLRAHSSSGDAWRCFLAEVALPFLTTPLFVFNSFQDEWQADNMLAPDPGTVNASGGLREWPAFVPCTHAPASGCSAVQYGQWLGLGGFLAHLNAALAASPVRARHGAFLHSCPTHGSAIFGRSSSVHLRGEPGGMTGMQALASWYRGEPASQGKVWVDDPWPSASAWPSITQPNRDCPAP